MRNAAVQPDSRLERSAGERLALLGVLLTYSLSRVVYYHLYEVRFDVDPLRDYLQLIDPELLRTRLWESLFHLRHQPPLFNLLIGASLQLAPASYVAVLHAIWLGCGLLLAGGTYALARRLGVARPLAALAAVHFSANPATALYENWLIYEYPLAACLLGATLCLHRYLAAGRWLDLFLVFGLTGAMALMRGTFHLAWYLAIVVAALLLSWGERRRIALAAALPGLLLGAVYVKNYWLFGDLVCGGVFRQFNQALMTTFVLPAEKTHELIRAGVISPAARLMFYNRPLEHYRRLVEPPPPVGVPLRDNWAKSTGHPNWHSDYITAIAALYGRDAREVYTRYPETYRTAITWTWKRYFLPVSDTYPFNLAGYDNTRRLGPLLAAWNRWAAGVQPPRRTSDLLRIVLPLAVITAVIAAATAAWQACRPGAPAACRAHALTLLFIVLAVLYVSIPTILLSNADQNRYRFCLTPLFTILLALLVNAFCTRIAAWVRLSLRPAQRTATPPPSGPPATHRRRRH